MATIRNSHFSDILIKFGDVPNSSTHSIFNTMYKYRNTNLHLPSAGVGLSHGQNRSDPSPESFDPRSYHPYHYNFPFSKTCCHTQKQKPTKIRPLNGRIHPEKNQLSGQFAIHRTGKKQRTFGDIVAPVFKKHRFLKTMHFCCLSQCIVACLQILMNLDESRCFISK